MALVESLKAGQLPSPSLRRAIRLSAGVSLREVGEELGVTAMTILRWERGDADPRRDRAIAYRLLLDALQDAAS